MGMLPPDVIGTDGGAQIRTETDVTQAEGYTEDMGAGAVFPPVVVFHDGAEYWLADGFHRIRAHQRLHRYEVDADVIEGTRRDAILYAVGANATHGLKRTNKCKRNAVMTLLRDPEWTSWPLMKIAATCAVSVGFVHKLHASFHGEKIKPAEREVTRGGTTYAMNTAPRPPWFAASRHSYPRSLATNYRNLAVLTSGI
jgi:hypothetical protein